MSEVTDVKPPRKPREKNVVWLSIRADDVWHDEESFESTAEALDWLHDNAAGFSGRHYRICAVYREGDISLETVTKTKVRL